MLRLALALFTALLLTACGGGTKKTNDTSQEVGSAGDSDMGGAGPDEMDDGEDEAGDTMPDDFGDDGAVDDM